MGRDKLRAYEARRAAEVQGMVGDAGRLIEQGRYDDAEKLVRDLQPDIQGGVTLFRLFRDRLEQLVAAGELARNRAGVEEVYRRALEWAHYSYPEPHTQMEAEQYAAGREADTAQLVKLLGYEPR